jgi:uncharacterized protein
VSSACAVGVENAAVQPGASVGPVHRSPLFSVTQSCSGADRYTTAVPPISNRKPAIAEFASRLREALPDNVLDIRLYGSEARGTASEDSDIDVLVVVQPQSERDSLQTRIVDIAFDVNLAFDVFISPFVITPEILNHPVWRETPFIETVLREGVPL